MVDIFITLIVVVVSWVYVYAQAHQIIYIKYLWFFEYQLYFSIPVKKEEKNTENTLKFYYFYLLYKGKSSET